jgi:hypothetical protein
MSPVTVASAVAALLLVAVQASAQSLPRLYPDSHETALARTGAPPALSDSADVYLLRRGGHVKVATGTNGAACLVARDHPESLYPICYDPEAARTIMLAEMERNRLRERGVPEDSVDATIQEGYRSGRLKTPSRPAIAYMMSRHQVIYAGARGPRVGAWFPHLMIYMPNATRAQLAMPGMPSGDLTLSNEGKPDAHYVVMTRDWANSASLPPAGPVLSLEKGWLCSGDEYSLTWSGNAAARLVRTAGGRREESVLTGPFRAAAREETELRVLGTNDSTLALDTVYLHPDRMEHNFVRPTTTCAGRLSVTSSAINPSSGSDRIKPRNVTNRGQHAVTITHRGITVRLAPGESTDRFNALPFTGDWGVVIDTGDYNKYCPAPTAPAPLPVDVLIVTECSGR